MCESTIYQDSTPGGDYYMRVTQYDKVQQFRQFCRDLVIKDMDGEFNLNNYYKNVSGILIGRMMPNPEILKYTPFHIISEHWQSF